MHHVNTWLCWLSYSGDNKHTSICLLALHFYHRVCLHRKWTFHHKVCMLYFFHDIYFAYSHLIKEKCVIKYLKVWTSIENFKFLIRHFVYTDMVHKGHSFCHILLWWSVDTFLRRCHIAMDKHIRADRSPLCHCIGHTRKTVHSLQSLGKPVRDSAHSSHL